MQIRDAAPPTTGRSPTIEDVRLASTRLAGVVRHTPLERSASLSNASGAEVFLKLECWQRTRSFKIRGAYNAIASLSIAARERGLVTASAGNHGLAVALAARELGAQATVFVPMDAPRTKQDRIRMLGADLRPEAADYDDAERRARAYARQRSATFVHAFSDPAVVAGQGTIALELLSDLPDLAEVVIPVGGGGLIAGIGLVLKTLLPSVRVIGVQSVETRAMFEAQQAGRVIEVPVTPTLADGLAGSTDADAFHRFSRVADELVLVEEHAIAEAIRALYSDDGVTVEGSAAVTAAAVRTGAIRLRGPAALIMSGSNIDGPRLARILDT